MSVSLNKRVQVSWPNGRQDKRYSVYPEFCGYSKPRYVARFCGEWISAHTNPTAAWGAAQDHKDSHSNY